MVSSRPVRPRTRAGRLAALDAWVTTQARALLDGRGAVVDVGFGLTPVTTLELALAVRGVTPALRVIGVEREAHEAPGLELLVGDFGTCATLGPTAVVRAMNVLRGYREDEVAAIHEALGAAVIDGGLVIEGSTDTGGCVTAAWLLRKRGGALHREALLLHTDFSRGFSPWLFRDWLPRDLRRRAHVGTAVHTLLADWELRARGTGATEPKARFLESLGPPLSATAWEREHGFVRWPVGEASGRDAIGAEHSGQPIDEHALADQLEADL